MRYKKGKNFKLIDKRSTFIDPTVKIGNNVTIYESNRIEGNTIIGDNCIILPGNRIKNCNIATNTTVESSVLEGATIGENTIVGPFARVRPTTIIGNNCRIGNFVEIKNSTIGDKTKVSHLAYVGDAEVGTKCNIGCGVIFINYNGSTKNKTTVGDNCFIGSNCNLIAPLTIESASYICAGTTVTENIKTGDFVIGRARQEIKPNRANGYLKILEEN